MVAGRDDTPRSIADGLSELVAKINPALVELGGAWRQTVGDTVARKAVPVRLEDGELKVVCESASWTCELQAQESEIIGRMRANGVSGIERIRCVTGTVTTS